VFGGYFYKSILYMSAVISVCLEKVSLLTVVDLKLQLKCVVLSLRMMMM